MNSFAPEPPVLWLTFEDASCSTWRVFVGNVQQIPQLEGQWGVTLVDQRLIAVSSEIPFGQQCLALFHEMHHAAVSVVGDPHTIAQILRCDETEVDTREESVVSFFAQKLFTVLVRTGLLKFPKIPKKRLGR